MIKFALAGVVLVAGACLTLPVSAAPLGSGDHTMRVAQADVVVKERVPEKKVIVKKPSARVVVKKRSTTACRTVTTHVREAGRDVVKKVRRCD